MQKLSLYQLKHMEYQPQLTLDHIIHKIPLFNFPTIIDFLDIQTIDQIYEAIKNITKNSNPFFSFLFVKRFIDKYLNATDRSAYINFYSEHIFLQIQKEHIRSLSVFYESNFFQIDKTFQDVRKNLANQLKFLQCKQQVVQSIFLNITDPLIPFPKMRKEHIGIHCNSGFQFYLIEKRFPPIEEDFVQECFQKMKQELDQLKLNYLTEEQNSSQNNTFKQKISKENKQKIKFLMKHWYRINSQNYRQTIIQQQSYIAVIHNSIVLIIVLIDNLAQSYDSYIDSIIDPFHQFAEFNLRYCMFRNIVLSLESQLSSLFQSYNEFYKKYVKSTEQMIDQHNSLQSVSAGKEQLFADITFWHCAFSKWYLHMKWRHDDLTNMYCYLLKNINLTRIKELIQMSEQHQVNANKKCNQVTNILKLSIQQHQILLQNRISTQYQELLNRSQFKFDSQIINLVQQEDMIHQFIKQYTEYMVDISVNQDSVHWCGHSDHEMHIPFRDYEEKVVSNMIQYLQNIFKMCRQIDSKNILFCEVLNTIFDEIDKDYLKPVTLKKIVNKVNQTWGSLVKQSNLKVSNQSTNSSYSTGTNQINMSNLSEPMECEQVYQIIQMNFSEQDKRLQYYNNKSNITTKFNYAYNILIQTDDFYNSMKKSTQTNYTNESSTGQKCRSISMDRSLTFSQSG